MLYFNVPVFYHYPVYFYRAVFKILHCFTACTDDETSISKRLNKDDPFTNRLRFNLLNSINSLLHNVVQEPHLAKISILS